MLGLRDGLEPDTPATDSLSRAAVLAHIETIRITAASLGIESLEESGWVGVDAGLDHPFANLVVTHGALDVATATEIDAAMESPHVIFSPTRSDDLRPLGYELMGHPPLMFRPAGDPGRLPEGIAIQELAEPGELDRWRDTMVAAYPMQGLDGVRWLGGGAVGGAFRFFLAERDGSPIATAAACVAAGVNLVTFVATMPEARGQGIGEAITWRATLADPTFPAMLIASDPGRPVYERMGYHALTRWTLWYRPTSRR